MMGSMRHTFPLYLAVVSRLFFVNVSHTAGAVEYNFTGSDHVICSSISAAIRNKLMLCTGGRIDYTHIQQVLTRQYREKTHE